MTVQARAIRPVLDEMAPMTAQQWDWLYRRTFDEARSQPRPCPCGKHTITSSAGPVLVCPWAPPHTGLHSQPDTQPLAE